MSTTATAVPTFEQRENRNRIEKQSLLSMSIYKTTFSTIENAMRRTVEDAVRRCAETYNFDFNAAMQMLGEPVLEVKSRAAKKTTATDTSSSDEEKQTVVSENSDATAEKAAKRTRKPNRPREVIEAEKAAKEARKQERIRKAAEKKAEEERKAAEKAENENAMCMDFEKAENEIAMCLDFLDQERETAKNDEAPKNKTRKNIVIDEDGTKCYIDLETNIVYRKSDGAAIGTHDAETKEVVLYGAAEESAEEESTEEEVSDIEATYEVVDVEV